MSFVRALALTSSLVATCLPANADSFDRMRDLLGPVQLSLFPEAEPLTELRVLDVRAAREHDLPLKAMTGSLGGPFLEGWGYVSNDQIVEAIAAEFGPATGQLEGVLAFGTIEAATVLTFADEGAAAAALAQVKTRPDATDAYGVVLLGDPAIPFDRAAGNLNDLMRGVLGKGLSVVADGARLRLGYGAMGDDLASGRVGAADLFEGEKAELVRVLPDVTGALVSGLASVTPDDALPFSLVLSGLAHEPVQGSLLTTLGADIDTTREAVERALNEAMPSYVGLAVADWRAPDGRVGASVALNYLIDCEGARDAAIVIAERWKAEAAFTGDTGAGEAIYGPLLEITAGPVGPEDVCVLAFALPPQPLDEASPKLPGRRLMNALSFRESPLLR